MGTVNCPILCRTAVFVAAAISLGACIVIPVPRLAVKDEVFIQQEKIDRIEIGRTDRRELQQTLGEPDWSFDSGSRLLYKIRKLSPAQMGTCLIVAVPAGFGAMGGGSCDDRWYETELLDIAFNDQGTVIQRDLFVADFGECTAMGVCPYEYGGVKVYALADDDNKAKEFRVEAGRCAVYLYTRKPARPDTTVRFQVDKNEYPFRFLEDSDFFRVELVEGPHTIGASVNWVKGIRPDLVTLNCEAYTPYFMRILIDGPEGASFGPVPADEGRREVLVRDLVLTRDSAAKTD